jgi:hypothetical protein
MDEPTTYDVVLLAEQAMSEEDARQVRGLHADAPAPVRYHLLLPVEDAAARVESAMGTLSSGDALMTTPVAFDAEDIADIQRDLLEQARGQLRASVASFEGLDAEISGDIVTVDPIDALVAKSKDVAAAEVIILTRPHVVAQFFHLDWTSRARRKLGVPVLHLIEHENFDEQAGGPDGITGF